MKLSVKQKLAVAFGIFLLGAIAAVAQTQPTAIAVSPANPLIAATQTQQFTTLSTTPLALGQARQIAAGAQHVCALADVGWDGAMLGFKRGVAARQCADRKLQHAGCD